MARVDRMKRRLVREAVDRNVDLIVRRPVGERRRHSLAPVARVSLVLLVPLLLYSAIRMATVDRVEAESTIKGLAMTLIPAYRPDGNAGTGSESFDPNRTIHHSAPDATALSIPLELRKIIIDPGHGGESPGTVTSNGLLEKDLVLDVGVRLKDLLLEKGFEVVMTRERDTTVTLEERVQIANDLEGDLFISIHINWIDTRDVRGVETYYLGPTKDPYLEQLTQDENRDSGYAISDFRRLLQGVYEQVREDESREAAEKIQRAMFRSLRQVNPKLRDRGVKTAPFVVLIGTEMPAILAEVSCLSNQEEARLLQKPRYRQYIAEALARGIDAYAESHPSAAKEAQVAERQ